MSLDPYGASDDGPGIWPSQTLSEAAMNSHPLGRSLVGLAGSTMTDTVLSVLLGDYDEDDEHFDPEGLPRSHDDAGAGVTDLTPYWQAAQDGGLLRRNEGFGAYTVLNSDVVLLRGVYFTRDGSTDPSGVPDGCIEFDDSNPKQIAVGVPDGLDGPAPGLRIWALVRLHGVHTRDGVHEFLAQQGTILYFEGDAGNLVIPDYGLDLSRNFARSRLAGLLASRLTFGAAAEVEADVRRGFLLAHTPAPGLTEDDLFDQLFSFQKFLGPNRRRLEHAAPPPLEKGGTLPLPEPRLVKTTRDAETYAAEVMRSLGFTDARPTPPGVDGGIDVVSSAAVAQVKMEGLASGAPVVQALYGVATVEGKQGLFFSLAGYTAQALAFADRAGVACFEFAFDGSIEAKNRAARNLLGAHTAS